LGKPTHAFIFWWRLPCTGIGLNACGGGSMPKLVRKRLEPHRPGDCIGDWAAFRFVQKVQIVHAGCYIVTVTKLEGVQAMGRRPIGKKAMTAAKRQRRHRAKPVTKLMKPDAAAADRVRKRKPTLKRLHRDLLGPEYA
jgi:hypothetical protein